MTEPDIGIDALSELTLNLALAAGFLVIGRRATALLVDSSALGSRGVVAAYLAALRARIRTSAKTHTVCDSGGRHQ